MRGRHGDQKMDETWSSWARGPSGLDAWIRCCPVEWTLLSSAGIPRPVVVSVPTTKLDPANYSCLRIFRFTLVLFRGMGISRLATSAEGGTTSARFAEVYDVLNFWTTDGDRGPATCSSLHRGRGSPASRRECPCEWSANTGACFGYHPTALRR